MAVRDMNDQQVVPGNTLSSLHHATTLFDTKCNDLDQHNLGSSLGINISLVVRDSQRPLPETNVSGGAATISATARLLAQDVSIIKAALPAAMEPLRVMVNVVG